MDRDEVADIFDHIATLLELQGENPFKSRAYTNAARVLRGLDQPLSRLVAEDRLAEIPSIGEALRKKIVELVTTGKLAYYDELLAAIPPGLVVMLDIPGLGPRKIKTLHDRLGIQTVEQLELACQQGRVAALEGFGPKTQARICEGISRRRSYASRHLLDVILPVAEDLLETLRAHPDVTRCSIAGSLRRHCEVISDIDFVASSLSPTAVLGDFAALPAVKTVLAKGETKASVMLGEGIQADLRVVRDSEFAPALMYFTGSKEHNVVMRQRAIQRGLRLNEYGLFRSTEETRDPALLVTCHTEHELFQELGLHFIPPEMREDAGEFALAEKHPVPRLLEWTDLRGSLHNHSTWSDGHQRPADIAKAMSELGLSYWAVTDHSKSSFQAHGLDAGRLLRQLDEICTVNAQLEKEGLSFRLLTGVEVDILKDGSLDLPDELLARLDVVVASIHQGFAGSEKENTERLIAAARNMNVRIMGHLTGRRLLEREAYRVNHHAVIDVCAETGTWIELNASPRRFDMDWRHWPYAKAKGVKCVINCDAHRFEQAGYLRLGAGIARKAGLTREDVVNTLPLDKLRSSLQSKKRDR